MAKTRKKRQTYTEEKRASILAAAEKGGLTAAQVKKKYGVTPVTYYSWRKKTGVANRRGGTTRAARRAGGLGASNTAMTRCLASRADGEPGKIEATCPSSPTPSTTTSSAAGRIAS